MQPKKILFANVPLDGHFYPLTKLAVHLKSIGYDVRWYTGDVYESKIKQFGIPYYPFSKALNFNQENLETVFPERKTYTSQVAKLKCDIRNVFLYRGPEYYADIQDIYSSWDFDAMVCDVAFTGIPFVKEGLGTPVISIGVLPLMETSIDLPPYGLGLTPSKGLIGRLKQNILRFVSDKVIFKESENILNDLFKKHNISRIKGNVFDILIKKSTLVLQSGTPGFEYERSDLGKNIRFLGPLLPYSNKQTEPYQNPKLSTFKKIILVTQGTVEKDPAKIIIPTLEAFKDSEYLVIATTGGSKTKELKEKYPQNNLIIEDFIPFNDIMPYTDVYITNGGYGGVMLGIQNQLPMVVAGMHEGKNEITARVGYFKLGINLGTETPSPKQIREAVKTILSDSTYKKNVKKLKEEFSNYTPEDLFVGHLNSVLSSGAVEQEVAAASTF